MDLPDYLPLSMLNQLEYCPRRFWLMFVEGEMEINAPVLEGTLQHEHAHGGGTTTKDEVVARRRIAIGSERLRLVGVADVIELNNGQLIPVEYKHGRMGKWLNDHVQLCAQALCLEERLGQSPILYGEIFYWGSRRRVRVDFTPELRARTEAAVQRAFDLLRQGNIPPPLPKALRPKCQDCSLASICLPEEVVALSESQPVEKSGDS